MTMADMNHLLLKAVRELPQWNLRASRWREGPAVIPFNSGGVLPW